MQTTVTVTELKAPETAETEKPKIRLAPYCRVSSPLDISQNVWYTDIEMYGLWLVLNLFFYFRRRTNENKKRKTGITEKVCRIHFVVVAGGNFASRHFYCV